MNRSAAASRIGIEHPVVQGPFGGGLSSVALAAAVSNAGGLGSYGAHQLSPAEIERVAGELRAATPAPFALNLWVSDHDEGGLTPAPDVLERAWRVFAPYFAELGLPKPVYPERFVPYGFAAQVDAVLAAKPAVFSFVFGIAARTVLVECRRLGIVTVGAATTIAEAQALEAAGVDLVVATGFEAGGHRPSFLASAEASLHGTFALTQLVSSHVRIPVIAAGGIVDRRGVRAALALGASAAQVGTAFLACEESGAGAQHRALLFESAGGTALTRAYTGRLARGIRNRYLDEIGAHVAELAPYPVTGWFAGQLKAAAQAQGRTDLGSLWSGQVAPDPRRRHAATLMTELVAGPDDASSPNTARVAAHASP